MPSLGLDSCLTLVADQRRRKLIQAIRHNETTTIDELVDQLYGAEQSTTTDHSLDRTDLTIQLHHIHLPKLAEYGVVDYDHDRGTVHYRPDEQVEAVLDSLLEGSTTVRP